MPSRKAKTLTQHETSEAPIGSERPPLEQRVLDYFHRNAHAMDSVGGVARFWVGENHGLVERCLVDLHGRGLLQKRTIAGTDFYSLQQEPQWPIVFDKTIRMSPWWKENVEKFEKFWMHPRPRNLNFNMVQQGGGRQ